MRDHAVYFNLNNDRHEIVRPDPQAGDCFLESGASATT